jgi:hypothetical protein
MSAAAKSGSFDDSGDDNKAPVEMAESISSRVVNLHGREIEREPIGEIEGDSFVTGDPLVLIPDGIYVGYCLSRETRYVFGGPRLVYDFAISDGKHVGARVSRFYGVRRLLAGPRQNGAVEVGSKSDLFRDAHRLFTAKGRKDRLRLGEFIGQNFEIRVRTVSKDSRSRAIPEGALYSIVDEVIKLLPRSRQS